MLIAVCENPTVKYVYRHVSSVDVYDERMDKD